jgi:hypothetical protein
MIKEGSLQDFSLPDLLQILALGNATGTLTLRSEGRVGQFLFRDGQLLDGRLGGRSGQDAAADLFLWSSGVFDFAEGDPGATGEAMPLEALTQEGMRRLERYRTIREELPDFFSPRAWVHPMQMYQEGKPALVDALGSGMSFGDLVRKLGQSDLAVLEQVAKLYGDDQVGLSCAPEEQLRQLFGRVANELFLQFASISGVKMVEGLETQLNEQARTAALGLRWRGGRVQDSLPETWTKEQLLAAYRPLLATMQEFVTKVYGASFVERVVQPLLDEVPAPQRALWAELDSTITTPL